MPRFYPAAFPGGKPVIEFSEAECLGVGGLTITGATNGPVFNACGCRHFTFWYTLAALNTIFSVAIADENGVLLGSEQVAAALATGTNKDISWHEPLSGSTGGIATFTKVLGPRIYLSFNVAGPALIRGRLIASIL